MPERNTRTVDRTVDTEAGNKRLRFELIFASVWLAVGLFLVPALIFWVGIVLLGPYGESQGKGLGSFYADFFGDLASGEVRTWLVTLGPLSLVSLVRVIFVGARRQRTEEPVEETSTPAPPEIKSTDHRRIEPRIGE